MDLDNELKNENIKYILKLLFNTQIKNQEKIINNILNGKKYVRFFIKNINSNEFLIEKREILKDKIPKFSNNNLYLPYIDRGNIYQYIQSYIELNKLVIKKIENRKIYLNISDTFKIMKDSELAINLTKTHDFIFTEKKENVENYYLIYHFLKENYPYEDKTSNAFYLDLNLEFIEIHASNFNFPLNNFNFNFIFFIPENESEKFYRLRDIPILKNLIEKEPEYRIYLDDKVDLNNSIEFIKTYNQIKNF